MSNSIGLQHQIRRLLSSGSFSDCFPITAKGGFDTKFNPILSAVEFRSEGTFVFYNRYGVQRTIEVDKGRFYPVFILKIDSTTTIAEGDIYGYVGEVEA